MFKLNKDDIKYLISNYYKFIGSEFKLDPKATRVGWELSHLVLAEPTQINLTPWMKNLLKKLDRLEAIQIGSEQTKAEKWVEDQTLKLLNKWCPYKSEDYPLHKDVFSWDYYSVDCWRNFKRGVDLRHVKPNMNADRKEAFEKFFKPIGGSNFIPGPSIIWALDKLSLYIPEVTPSFELKANADVPFEAKSSNVGYPYFKNDKALRDGKTYAEICLDDAKQADLETVIHYPYTALTRNMRQKARPILGSSRVENILLNCLSRPEIQAYKDKSPIFVAYRDVQEIKSMLIKMGNKLSKLRVALGNDVTLFNRDFSHYDTTIAPQFKLWCALLDLSKLAGSEREKQWGRRLISARTISTFKTKMVYGYNPSSRPLVTIYGRILSGEKVTNTSGGKINFMLTMATNYELGYSDKVDSMIKILGEVPPMQVCGDDCLTYVNKDIQNRFSDMIKNKFGLTVHVDKGEYGMFFLQRRVVNTPQSVTRVRNDYFDNSKYTIATPFTRIIRSLVFRENPTGLGPAGWILMAWSVLAQIAEVPELFIDVARIIIPLDDYRLGANMSINDLIAMLKKEDALAAKKTNRSMTTAEKLNDGDPIKQTIYQEVFGGKKSEYLTYLHTLIKKAAKLSNS